MNNDSVPTSGHISIRCGGGLVPRKNTLVSRGLQDLAQLGETRADEFFDLAFTYLKNGDFDPAIIDFTEAILLDPKPAKTYNGRGVAYWEKGDLDKAIADYTEAIRLDPNDAWAYYSRGRVYQRRDNHKAELDFDQAKRLGLTL